MLKKNEVSDPNSCLNKAGNDEMIFVLRAKDPAAPYAIRAWILERARMGLNTLHDFKIIKADGCAREMALQKAQMERPT